MDDQHSHNGLHSEIINIDSNSQGNIFLQLFCLILMRITDYILFREATNAGLPSNLMDDQQSANRYDAADTENVTSIMDNQQPVPL